MKPCRKCPINFSRIEDKICPHCGRVIPKHNPVFETGLARIWDFATPEKLCSSYGKASMLFGVLALFNSIYFPYIILLFAVAMAIFSLRSYRRYGGSGRHLAFIGVALGIIAVVFYETGFWGIFLSKLLRS